ncbi:hypothetical protein ACFSYH_10460 [Populibacterium corticicola]|uniref:PH domain-containing protein n=1 Tax=Populibacterium corticicola TaxID=1812826 RepID=A0ABW5XHX3_9MICO
MTQIGSPETEDEWLIRLRKIVEEVRALETQPEGYWVPESGSAASRDDKETLVVKMSDSVSYFILTASQCLSQLADGLEKDDGVLRPIAPFVLLRTALIGASQALWVLQPKSRADRVSRLDRLTLESYRNMGNLVTEMSLESWISDEVTSSLESSAAHLSLLREKYKEHKGKIEKPINTEIIKDVADILAPQESNRAIHVAIRELWQSSSGYTHAFPWVMHVRHNDPEDRIQTPEGNSRRIQTTYRDLGSGLGVVLLLVKTVLELWETRSTNWHSDRLFPLTPVSRLE